MGDEQPAPGVERQPIRAAPTAGKLDVDPDLGNAAAGAGYCGCTIDSDCTPRKCVTFTVEGTFPAGYCQ